MADRDLTALDGFVIKGPVFGSTGDGYGGACVLKFHIDIDAIEASEGYTVGSTDVLHLWDIPVGTEIRKVMTMVRTAPTAPTSTVAIGDSDSGACYQAAGALTAAGTVRGSAVSTDAYAIVGGRLYIAANILHVTFAVAAPAGGVFDVYVFCTFATAEFD